MSDSFEPEPFYEEEDKESKINILITINGYSLYRRFAII